MSCPTRKLRYRTAATQRGQGHDAHVVMGLDADQFLVVTDTTP
jgi:hypothetical protein